MPISAEQLVTSVLSREKKQYIRSKGLIIKGKLIHIDDLLQICVEIRKRTIGDPVSFSKPVCFR